MTDSLKGKKKAVTPPQLELLEAMQKLRETWMERRMRRVQVIQDLHC
jgi:hypothetical protein